MQHITLIIDINTHERVIKCLLHKSPISPRFKVVIMGYALDEPKILLHFTQNNIDIEMLENHILGRGHKSSIS